MTVFLYLNTVEEGGGTHFPVLNLTIAPKKGRAVVWPSVFDFDPNRKDPRTAHEAQAVLKGQKFGANAWIHLRGYKNTKPFECNT